MCGSLFGGRTSVPVQSTSPPAPEATGQDQTKTFNIEQQRRRAAAMQGRGSTIFQSGLTQQGASILGGGGMARKLGQ